MWRQWDIQNDWEKEGQEWNNSPKEKSPSPYSKLFRVHGVHNFDVLLWMPYSSNLALLPTSWKCRVCNTKVQCIFSTSFNAWSSKLGPYLTYSLVHEMIYLLLELKNNKLATVRSRKKYYFYRASSMFKSTFHVLNNNDKSWLKTIHDRELRLLEASGA